MKKIILLMLLLLTGASLSAQTLIQSDRRGYVSYRPRHTHMSNSGLMTGTYVGQHHVVGTSFDMGYSRYLYDITGVAPSPGGYTAGWGMTYMYQNTRFILQTGAALRWQTVRDTMGLWTRIDNTFDTQGMAYRLRYDFYSRSDLSRNIYVEIPLQFGAYIYAGLYATAGLKARMQIYGFNRSKAVGTTRAYYDRYIGLWEQMDTHGYQKDVPFANTSKGLKLGFDLSFTSELGYEFRLPDDNRATNRRKDNTDRRVRLAAFADVSILNIRPSSTEPVYTIPEQTRYDFPSFVMQHPLQSEWAYDKAVRNIFAGVKVTYFFWGIETRDVRVSVGARGRKYRQ